MRTTATRPATMNRRRVDEALAPAVATVTEVRRAASGAMLHGTLHAVARTRSLSCAVDLRGNPRPSGIPEMPAQRAFKPCRLTGTEAALARPDEYAGRAGSLPRCEGYGGHGRSSTRADRAAMAARVRPRPRGAVPCGSRAPHRAGEASGCHDRHEVGVVEGRRRGHGGATRLPVVARRGHEQ